MKKVILTIFGSVLGASLLFVDWYEGAKIPELGIAKTINFDARGWAEPVGQNPGDW